MSMPSRPSQSIPIGTVVGGKYRVERHVGDGGMGLVVAARHLVLNELFAIKFMHHRDLANEQAVGRFVREAQAVVKLKNNEHVARVHDVGKHDTGDLYIVMELLEGQDLGAVLKMRGVLPIHEACSYVVQACNALTEAHDLGIIHRDLKPANLFLTHRKDGSSCIKVLDFGISKVIAALGSESDAEMTGTREMMGSPLYMSPEQARSARDVDARTDIWSLGAILYKLLTGKAPIPGQSLAEVSFALLEPNPVRPPSEIRRDIPRPLEVCILRCLEKNANRRYGRVSDLIVALAPFASRQSSLVDDEDNAATVLRPVGTSSQSAEMLGGGTLPLVSARSIPAIHRKERSGTDIMAAYRPEVREQARQTTSNAQTTQLLDGRGLHMPSSEGMPTDRKPGFTGRIILPPVSATVPSPTATPLPSSPAPHQVVRPGGWHELQQVVPQVTGQVPRLAMMPPPIPPAYPTGGYPIAPAARTTLPSATTAPPPDVTEPPWNRTNPKPLISSRKHVISGLVFTVIVGGLMVVFLMRRLNPVHSATPDASSAPKAIPSVMPSAKSPHAPPGRPSATTSATSIPAASTQPKVLPTKPSSTSTKNHLPKKKGSLSITNNPYD